MTPEEEAIQRFLSGDTDEKPPEKKPSLKLPTTLALLANAGDIITTQQGLRGGYGETNPFLSRDPWANTIGQIGADAAAQLLIHKLVAPNHPKLAKFMEYGMAGLGGVDTVRNIIMNRDMPNNRGKK